MLLFCALCKVIGHSIDNCRKYSYGSGITCYVDNTRMKKKLIETQTLKDVATTKKLVKKYVLKKLL